MKFETPGGKLVLVYLHDITFVRVEAIVNVGNKTLTNRNGLNREILKSAGKHVVDEIKAKINSTSTKSLDFGETLVTGAGRLHSKNIIHTVSATYDAKCSNTLSIEKLMKACLKSANEKKFKTLAFPAIGTGLSHFSLFDCVDAYVNVLKSWKKKYPEEIHFIIFQDDIFQRIETEFTHHFSPPAPQSRNSKTSNASAQDKADWAHEKQTSPSAKALNGSTQGKTDWTHEKQTSPSAKALNGSAQSKTDWTLEEQTSPSAKALNGSAQSKTDWTLEKQTSPSAMASGVSPTASPTKSGMTNTNDQCPICICDFTNQRTLSKCGHSFCSGCIDHSFSVVGPYCPICQTVYGKVIGLQPPGRMTVQEKRRSLPGFPECTMYQVNYDIPHGIQKNNHPNPGRSFSGANRTAYLPSNKEGVIVLKMLQRAFQQKLIFTVGVSHTTNQSDVVTWNDIHHKTKVMGGSSRYGYPDPGYLQRVSQELAAKGITPADVLDQEIQLYISN